MYVCVCVSRQSVQLFETSWNSSRQECWSGLSFPSPEDLRNPGIKPGSLALQADSLPSELPGKPSISVPYSLYMCHLEAQIVSLGGGLEMYIIVGKELSVLICMSSSH